MGTSDAQADAGKRATKRAPRRSPVTAQELMDAAVDLSTSMRSVSSLSLREVARAAGIAPNSFYRHFRDVDELAVAVIDQAGRSLRGIIREARQRISPERSMIRTSVEAFMEQVDDEQRYLHVLLREMSIGSEAFRRAVERELSYFEDELCEELVRLGTLNGQEFPQPLLAARAITRLVFNMGASAVDRSREERAEMVDQLVIMVRMIIVGAQTMPQSMPRSMPKRGKKKSP